MNGVRSVGVRCERVKRGNISEKTTAKVAQPVLSATQRQAGCPKW
jgi:hypothetical protein